jgi:hypothetical protein
MRLIEIICEASSLERVMNATRRKNDATRRYQERLRTIRQTAPCGQCGEKERAAREQFQNALGAADDQLRRALADR